MKKFFYFVAFVAAISFAACGTKNDNKQNESSATGNTTTENTAAEQEMNSFEQGFIEGFIEGMDEELAGMEEDGMKYTGTVVDGKSFICTFTIDESQFGGMSMKQAFAYVGMTEDIFAQTMKTEMFDGMTDEEADLMSSLYMLKYDLIFRLVGSESGDVMNCKIGYEEFAR